MIGVAGEKGPGTVDLLGEHDAGESVRQGDGAERHDPVGLELSCQTEAIGASDEKGELLGAPIAELRQGLREFLAAKLIAAAVETDQLV